MMKQWDLAQRERLWCCFAQCFLRRSQQGARAAMPVGRFGIYLIVQLLCQPRQCCCEGSVPPPPLHQIAQSMRWLATLPLLWYY